MKTKRVSNVSDVATAGARAARKAYGLDTTDSSTYDAKRGTSVYEIKTARMRMPSGDRGRFQIFKTQHTRLRNRDNGGSAWYVFVVLSGSKLRNRDNGGSAWYVFVVLSGSKATMVRKNPARIGRLIASRGGFRDMGHASGPRHRIPISALFDV
jgi:hypothetical protein